MTFGEFSKNKWLVGFKFGDGDCLLRMHSECCCGVLLFRWKVAVGRAWLI